MKCWCLTYPLCGWLPNTFKYTAARACYKYNAQYVPTPTFLKISGKIERHYDSKCVKLIVYYSQFLSPLLERLTNVEYCNHKRHTNNSSFETYHTKTYKNAYKLTWPLNTNLLIFKSWSRKACYDDMECLCILSLAFSCSHLSTSGFQQNNKQRWANLPFWITL